MPVVPPITPGYSETSLPLPPAVPAVPVITAATDSSAPGIMPPGLTAFTADVLTAQDLNYLLGYINVLGRGGAGIGVLDGLTLSQTSGLTLNVAAGTAMIGAPIYLAASTYVLPASQATVFVWLKSDGTLTHTLTSTAPAGSSVYLGVCATSGSAITAIDVSGVMKIADGIRMRFVAGYSKPADAPSSATAFLMFNQAGAWLWNGLRYVPLGGSAKDALTVALLDVATTTLTDAQSQPDTLVFGGTLTATRIVVLSPIGYGQWTIYNGTNQSLTFKTASGTGITVATGKHAILRLDSAGLNMLRVTADT